MRLAVKETETENLFETLANESPVGLYIVQDGRFCYTNPTFQSTTGYKEDELLDRDALELVVPEDRKKVRENAIKMLKGERTLPYQFRVTHKNGSIKWVIESVVSIQYRGRRATLGDFIDITERKEAEEELKVRAQLLNGVTDSILVHDFEGNFVYVNEMACRVHGYSREEFMKMKLHQVIVPERVSRLDSDFQEMLEKGQVIFESVHLRKDGSIMPAEVHGRTIESGGRKLILTVVRDITERKQAEEKLRESELSLTAAQRVARMGSWDLDLARGKGTWSAEMFRLTGFDPSKGPPTFTEFLEWVHPEDQQHFSSDLHDRVRQTGKSATTEFRSNPARGPVRIFLANVSATRDAQGHVVKMIGTLQDITERKQAEEKVQHLNLVLRAIRNINQLIARGTDRDSLLKGACDTFVKTRGYYSAWIALLDESGKLVTAAEAGLGKSFLQVIERLKRGELTHCGCKVLEKPGVLVMKDVSSECEDCPLSKEDTDRGAMSVRLEYGGKVYGLMTVYIPPGRAAEKEEHDLLEEIAGDIAFALYSIEQEQERKQAEQALREAEEEKSALLEEAPISIVHTDLKGKITYINKRFESESGYSREEIVGKNGFKMTLVPAGTMKYLAKRMAARLRGGPSKHWETQFKCKDGRWIWVDLEGKVLRKSGVPVGFQIIARNTTDRKRAEEALQAEKSKLESVIDALEDSITILDRDHNILYQSKPSSMTDGYNLGEKCYLVYEGRDKVCDGCPVAKAFGDGKSHTSGRRVVKPSGEVFFVENTANPIRDAKGNVVSCVEVTRDVTERKQAEETLQAEKNKLQSVIDALEDGITILDRDYNILYQSKPSSMTGGYYLGEKCYRAYEGKDKVCDGCPVAEAFRDGKSHTSERSAVTLSGEVLFLENTANPIRDAKGNVVSCVEVTRDITERKQAEEVLQAEKNKLESLVDAIEYVVSIYDKEYNIIYQNERARAHGGARLGEKCYRVYQGRETVCDGCPVEKAFKDGKSHTIETKAVTPSGAPIFVESTASPIKDARGRVISCLEIVRNITGRKQAEEELKLRAQILDSATDAIFVHDEDDNFIYVNEAACRIHGYTREEFLKMKLPQLVAPEYSRLLVSDRQALLKKGHIVVESAHLRKDGSLMPLEVHARTIESGGRKLFLTVARDITERKRAEETLQLERNKLQSIIDAMHDDLTIQDRDYNVLFQNELSRISSGGDHLGEKCYLAYEGREKICEGCPVEMAFKDGKPHTSERQRVLPSGEVTFWENTANPIRDARGEIFSCLEIGRDITERKKQEQILADELAQRRLLIDKSLDGIVVLDVDAAVVDANQRFADMLGYTLEEVHEMHTWDWDKNFPREEILEQGRNVDEKGLHLETKHTRKDGSVIDVDISISGIMYGGRKLIFCIQRDITERNRALEALKNSEESYRELADSITEVFFAMDEHLRYTYWNKASEILTGVRVEDALGKSLSEVFPDSPGLRKAEKVYRAVLKTQKSRTFVNDFDIDGRHYVFEIGAYPSRGGISVFVRDITERKRAEEAIKHAAEEWRETFDSITDAISIHDRDYKILRANKAFADVFHKKPSQVIGRYCYELHKGNKPISGCPHKQTLATKEPAAAEFYESNLGKYLHESTSPIFDEKGEAVGTVHITRDITEQKQQNERLTMADRLASIGELAAGTAHELNNPLTSVIGFSQLLMEKDIPDDIREDLAFIYNEAQRAANVTKNLLTFGRKHVPVKQPNQINNIIEDVLKLRAYEHKVNSIEVKRRLAPDLPEISVDYFQMQQVFLNIIINAEHFMTEAHNSGTLTITTKKQNSNVRISITDDGPGISKENLSRIFDPFFTTKEAGKGTGLGLSICHGIVSEHGGQIYARSQPDKGATIVVELPINSH